jgi:hypothetical protein
VDRLTGFPVLPAPLPCETCCGWSPQVFVWDHESPRGEVCPGFGRRVAITLVRVYHLVDLDSSEAGEGSAASS